MSKLTNENIVAPNHPNPEANNIKHLYKYYSFNKEHPEYLDDIFLNKKLYHSLPKDLNDPFEAKPKFRVPNGAKENQLYRKHIRKILKSKNPKNLSTKEIDKLVSDIMANPKRKVAVIYSAFLTSYSESRVCCFTTANDNLLMWSHYANSHTGLCIGFNAKNSPFYVTYKVSYEDDKYPIIKFPIKEASIFDPLLNKAKCWVYEEEYRSIMPLIIKNHSEYDGVSYFLEKDDITDIYLGISISKSDKDRLQALIKKSIFSPRIWQATTNYNSYSIKFIPLDHEFNVIESGE